MTSGDDGDPFPEASALDMTFSVRAAAAADLDQMVALYTAVAAEGRWIAAEPPVDGDELRDRWAQSMDSRHRLQLVADADGTIVGLAGVDLAPYGVASLAMLVALAWRRRGVGTALVETAVAAARELGSHKVALQVWPHNAGAIALYRRAGFAEEGVLRRHYRRRNGELWDAVVMGLVLEEDPVRRRPSA